MSGRCRGVVGWQAAIVWWHCAACLLDGSRRLLLQEVHDRRLSAGRIRRRISVDLPGVPGRLPSGRRHPPVDRVVRLVHAVVRPAVDGYGSLAPRRFGRVDLARGFKSAGDLDAEVAQYRRARLRRVMVEEDVVAVSPQPRLAADEVPDLALRRPPRRPYLDRRVLAPHRGQLAGVNSLYADGDRHSPIVCKIGPSRLTGVVPVPGLPSVLASWC